LLKIILLGEKLIQTPNEDPENIKKNGLQNEFSFVKSCFENLFYLNIV